MTVVLIDHDIRKLFTALEAELRRVGAARIELCVVGGTALNLLGIVDRPTKDVDVLALCERTSDGPLRLVKASPFPPPLRAAADRVALEFGLAGDWLNGGPSDLLDHGMPAGFTTRLSCADYGPLLRVHVASRADLVCLKTAAAADSGGRHLSDLLLLVPSAEEMATAFAWVLTQDGSAAFRSQLAELARHLEVEDVLERCED